MLFGGGMMENLSQDVTVADESKVTYQDYYMRAINQQLRQDSFGALKLVVGPTGLGKTYAIRFVIDQLRQRGVDKRCIYTTHRHMLIDEMAEDLGKLGIPSVYLKSNRDVVSAFVDLPGRDSFLTYLDNSVNFFEGTDKSLQDVNKAVKGIRRLSNGNYGGVPQEAIREINGLLHSRCNKFIKIFESGLRSLKKKNESAHRQLLQHPLIWQLFPYVEFLYNPERPVLLVTVSKLLHGFFDGVHKQRLTSLKDNVIFMDEFEIQESVILSFLCEDKGINNNFEFVRLFYNEMTSQRQLNYLDPNPNDRKERHDAKQTITTILDELRRECVQGRYNYPAIARFRINRHDFANTDTITVFQSNHIIQTTPFFLVDEGNAWRIVKPRSAHTLSSYRLLYIVSRTTDDILEFFAGLWADGLEAEWREWIEHCYNKRNDNVCGAYQTIISKYGVFKRQIKFQKGRQAGRIRDSIYYKGFNLYKLTTGKYEATSPDEVLIQQKSLHITPEYLLWQLCQSNLLFGISATGDIPRYVKAFDLKWLQDKCNYLPINEQDTALIAQMKEQKRQGRKYDIRFDLAKFLPETHRLNRFLEALEMEDFFESEKQKATDSRRHVVNRFLETARWVTHESQNQAHLVFVNSFRFIQKMLDKKREMHESGRDDLTQHFVVENGSSGQEYRITIDGAPCYVILLNAKKAREDDPGPFQPDSPNGKLIVVTQYETAANGVNLEWVDDPNHSKSRYDFQGIHLLEGKHYYFNTTQSQDDLESLDYEKMFIWQAWKVAEGRQISPRKLEYYLKTSEISHFNANVYKKTPDYLLNQVALFHQAFGRVDRKRNSTHTTEVRLADTSSVGKSDDSVFQLLARYLKEVGAIGEHRDQREVYTSDLILEIHKAVAEASKQRQLYNQFCREDISDKERGSRERIQDLLRLIEQMKNGAYPKEEASKIKKLWHDVREAMLRQDYQFTGQIKWSSHPKRVKIDFQRDFVHKTAYLQADDKLYLDRVPNPTTIFREATPNTQEFNLNWPYRHLADNRVIRLYFDTRNYQLRYYHTTPGYIFTPHAIQAILAGAVGEAALQALLEEEHIMLENPNHHDSALFEQFDLKVKDKPIYLDAKSFSQETIYRMNAQPDDPDYNPNLNAPRLLQKAQEKWGRIVNHTKEANAKFVIINLQVDGERSNEYWDGQLNRVSTFRESAITIIQGALEASQPDQLRSSFKNWLKEVKDF